MRFILLALTWVVGCGPAQTPPPRGSTRPNPTRVQPRRTARQIPCGPAVTVGLPRSNTTSPVYYKMWIRPPNRPEYRGVKPFQVPNTVSVTLSTREAYVDDRAVGVTIRQGRLESRFAVLGKKGWMIARLYKPLLAAARRFRKQGPCAQTLVLWADARLSFRLLLQVLDTARQAGFRNAELVVQRSDGKQGAVVLMIPEPPPPASNEKEETHDADEEQPLGLAIIQTDSAYFIRSRLGTECPANATGVKCFDFGKGGPKSVSTRLATHLHQLMTQKYGKHRLTDRHRVMLVLEPHLKLQAMVDTADAVRSVPKAGECKLKWHTRCLWELRPARAGSCLFPHVEVRADTPRRHRPEGMKR